MEWWLVAVWCVFLMFFFVKVNLECLYLFREQTCKRLPQVADGLCVGHVFAGGTEKGCIFQAKGTAHGLGFAGRQDNYCL